MHMQAKASPTHVPEHWRQNAIPWLLLLAITFPGAIGTFGMAACLCAAAGQDDTRAQAKLDAAYTITFARVSVGKARLSADFRDNAYTIAATASAGGVMRILIDGEASLTANGVVRDGRLVPTSFASLSVSSMVANLIISANRFAASVQPDPAAPSPVGPGAQ
jgi:hypothetical protein